MAKPKPVDAIASSFGDCRALNAHLGRHGIRRVRVGTVGCLRRPTSPGRRFRLHRPLKAFSRGATECEGERGRYERGKGWVDFVCISDTVDPRGPKGK
jgi:hypothetical protein